ncbi:hypothetical protein H0E87_000196 [Populus deltoides]|uniref:Uncharacterized protein n=1 Tax=Populus deltoides TaxID=3696 RepID=A0A8T2ZLS2_POPDE|nr:hypothetical protein H0E87_000196 [Populus deltoides]
MKAVIDNGIHIQFNVTFWIGEFTVQDDQRVHVLMSSLRDRESEKVVDEITYFLTEVLPHCPKTLKSLVVVSSAEMPEFRSEVNAFVTKEKALELTKLMFYMPAIRGWFNDTKNDMWLVQKCELRRSKYTEGDFTSAQFDLPSVTETDIKELLCACEEEGGGGDYENEQQ